MNGLYILKEGKPIQCQDVHKWAIWFGAAGRVVKQTMVGKVEVSTVFLGIDHGFGGRPVLWETMIFGGIHNHYQRRYISRKAAVAGHKEAVKLAKESNEQLS